MEHLMPYIWNSLLGLAMGGVVVFVAYRKEALSLSGGITAVFMGTVIFVTGGWYSLLVLMVFFVSSSLLGLLHLDKPSSKRSYLQVLANGGIGMVLCILWAIFQTDLLLFLFTISFAVSTADTWSSEIGTLSKTKPRHALKQTKMETGMSGAVTPLGLFAAVLGAALIACLYLVVEPAKDHWYLSFVSIVFFGVLGSYLDSILGTVQVKYVDFKGRVWDSLPPSEEYSSRTGLPWLSNNLVNLFSNAIIVLIALWFFGGI